MRKAIGVVIVIYAISHMLSEPFEAFSKATTATFNTVEVAAVISKLQLLDMSN